MLNRFAAEREWFTEHPGQVLDEARRFNVELCVEPWSYAGKEIFELAKLHYEEIEGDGIELAPDWERYGWLEREDKLHVVTARDDGFLVGYDVGIVDNHIHHRNTLMYFSDVTYIKPEYRKGTLGIRLIAFSLSVVRKRGVKKIFLATSVKNDIGRLYERLGYQPAYVNYTMRLP
jgi:GNAT superfamily N-acetyltransferase